MGNTVDYTIHKTANTNNIGDNIVDTHYIQPSLICNNESLRCLLVEKKTRFERLQTK